MRLFIAEKPELGRAIAAGLGNNQKREDGYIKVDNNVVTWAFGHILQLQDPAEYNKKWQKWTLESLPITLSAAEFKTKPKETAVKQLKVIINLIKSPEITTIVNSGDPDEEGTILVDEIIKYSKTDKPVERILINDLTEKAVKKAILEIKPFSSFINTAKSGYARSYADWLVGFNFTRFYTIKGKQAGHSGVLSVGRVQSPILNLIVQRDKEHEEHKESIYYSIKGNFNVFDVVFTASLSLPKDEKITDLNEVEKIKQACTNKTARTTIKTENLTTAPPLPFNLVNLQIAMSKKHKLKPAKTLEITQVLREKYKLITYNRSDCEYLPEDFHTNAPAVIAIINHNFGSNSFGNNPKLDISLKSAAFNNSKITAHHAIVPTETKIDVSILTSDELKAYQAIVERYLLQFFPKKEYRKSSISLKIDDYVFVSSYSQTINPGWTEVQAEEIADENKNTDEDNENSKVDFGKYNDKDTFICKEINSKEMKTKPLPYFKQETLLKALVSLSNYVKDPKIKALLLKKDDGTKARGSIGTEATRAMHIETLYKRNYIEDIDKGFLRSTTLGREFIKQLPNFLTSPDMTALWFEKQEQIKSGTLTLDEFITEINAGIKSNISNDVKLKLETAQMAHEENIILCPVCGKGQLKRWQHKEKKYFYWNCSAWKENCCKAFFYDDKGKPKIENDDIICPVCKMGKLRRWKSKDGKSYYWNCSAWKTNGCKAWFADKKGKPEIK